jgi:hypothetical protein
MRDMHARWDLSEMYIFARASSLIMHLAARERSSSLKPSSSSMIWIAVVWESGDTLMGERGHVKAATSVWSIKGAESRRLLNAFSMAVAMVAAAPSNKATTLDMPWSAEMHTLTSWARSLTESRWGFWRTCVQLPSALQIA